MNLEPQLRVSLVSGRSEFLTDAGVFEALEFLHATGSAYILVSAAFNFLVKSVYALLTFYITSGIVGLCAALMLHERRSDDLARFLSVAAMLGGVMATGWVWYIGLASASGIFGPGWVIFLITAWKLWQATPRRRRKKRLRRKTVAVILILAMTVSLVGAPLFHLLGSTEWTVALAYIAFVVTGTILFRQS